MPTVLNTEGHGLGSDSKEQGAEDLWELTIDDLFSSSDAAASELHAAVPGPYAIDLCTSPEPALELAPSLQGFDYLHAYHVTDWKDDQLVFRLRLGPIESELEADAILSIVRSDYPSATTVPMGDDDQRMIALVATSAPPRNAKAPERKTAVPAKADNADKPARVEKGAAAGKVPPVLAVAQPLQPEPVPEPAVRAAQPATPPPAEKTEDLANLFRDLAAELLAPVPVAAAAARPRPPEAPPTAGAAAAAPPPVLTAAVRRPHAPRSTNRTRGEPPPRTRSDAPPPVLMAESVAKPAREAAERPAGTAAAQVPASGVAEPRSRREPPFPAAALPAKIATVPAEAVASKGPAALRAPEPVAPSIPATEPAPPPMVAAPDARSASPAAPTPPAPVPLAPESPRVAPPRAAHTPGKAPAPPAPSSGSQAAVTERAAPAVAGAAPPEAIVPAAPAAVAGAAVATSSQPPRVALPRAPSRAAVAGDPSGRRDAPGASDSKTVPANEPRVQAEPGPEPRLDQPPRVALRPEPAPNAPSAKAAEAIPAKRPFPAASPPQAPSPRSPTPAPRAPAAAVAAERPATPTLDLELVPDDLERATAPAPATPAATSAAPGSGYTAPARIATPPLELELVPDATPPPPAPAAAGRIPPVAAKPVAPGPAPVPEPSRAPLALTGAPGRSPDPKADALPPRGVTPPTPPPFRPPAAPSMTAPAGRATAPAQSTAPSAASGATARSATRSDAAPSKPGTPPRAPEPRSAPAKPATPAAGSQPPAMAAAPAATAAPAASAARKPGPDAGAPPGPPPIDSTQTLRALVVPEDAVAASEKLLVIQLLLSEREIQPESVPNLAIFNEYRLYSAVGYEQGKVMHALRLGFFTDDGPAEAVAGYLRSYFEAPVVTRVSAAERERFGRRRVSARKDSGDTGLHAAIELSSAPTAPTTSLADLSARSRPGSATKSGHERKRG